MELSQALATAANIMLLGMVCVFAFLGTLVIAVKIVAKLCPQETPVTPTKSGTSSSQVSPNVVAAIAAAVHQYRNSRGKPQDK